ncbi:retrovirus-related Pol polyprotein from transposon 17.6 [Trichonephila clavipes]|nr:retrovirus-related Pol polyprotein from transposon 17.6 [Trichonephila clavipes]
MRLEELERAEKMRLEELERAEKMRLEELVKEQALKEKELQLKFDLERFKIESGFRVNDESNDSTNACSVTSNLNLKKLIPDFDPKQSDISLYLVIFERQAKRASIEKKEWVGQLLEDEILIPALQEYVPELALLRVTRENLINAQKNSEEIKPLYEQAASQVQVTNQVYSLEKELLVKNREDKLGNVVKLIVVPEGLRDPIKSLCHEGTSAHLGITKSKTN